MDIVCLRNISINTLHDDDDDDDDDNVVSVLSWLLYNIVSTSLGQLWDLF